MIVTLNDVNERVDIGGFGELDIVVIRNPSPRGFARNHNHAFSLCRTEWFVVLNPDVRLPNDPFMTLLAAACSDSSIAAVAPVVVNVAGTVEDSVRRNLSPLSVLARSAFSAARVSVAPTAYDEFVWFGGMFLMFRSDAFAAVGGFDERFFLYCEDYDICARLYLAGYRLHFEPQSMIVHDARRDSHRSLKHLSWHTRSLLRVWLSAPFWKILLGIDRRQRS